MAGAVENTPNLTAGSSVTFQCGKYINHTKTPPTIPPSI